MKVSIFGTSLLHPVNQEYTVSGHAQIPLMTARILANSGFDVDVITTSASSNHNLPSFVPDSVGVRTVPNIFAKENGRSFWEYPKFLKELRSCISDSRIDIMHFFGFGRMGVLARFITSRTNISETYMTYVNYRGKKTTGLFDRLDGNLDHLYFLTQYTRDQFRRRNSPNVPTTVTRPGLIREFDIGSSHSLFDGRDYVLFWRNAHPRNGADICRSVFERLSSDYPNTEFVFAVRHNDIYEPKLESACSRHSNLHLLRYPYADGITIEKLLTGSSVVVLPFRKLSINPQFAILETLASGSALITSSIGSNTELVRHDETGILTALEKSSVKRELANLLDNPEKQQTLGQHARAEVETNWNWDAYKESLQTGYTTW